MNQVACRTLYVLQIAISAPHKTAKPQRKEPCSINETIKASTSFRFDIHAYITTKLQTTHCLFPVIWRESRHSSIASEDA